MTTIVNVYNYGDKPRNIILVDDDIVDGKYQNDTLKELVAMRDFNVFTNGGTGGLLNEGDGYTFDSYTGTLTIPANKYVIIF